jgi:Xaa-Pro aminopeptidase
MYEERVSRLQKIMNERSVAAVLLSPGVNMYYFTGLMKEAYERFLTVIIPAHAEPMVLLPSFEEESVKAGLSVPVSKKFLWKEEEDPYGVLARVMKENDLGEGAVAIDGAMQYSFFHRVQKALPGVAFADSATMIGQLRIEKSKEEVELVRRACKIIGKGMEAAFESVAPGRTEKEVFLELESEIRRQGGAPTGYGGVLSGPVSALPHGESSDKKIVRGETVLIDVGWRCEWYFGDLTRTVVVGQAPDKLQRIYKVVLEAQRQAIERVAPEVEAQAIDGAARRLITQAGFGPNFTHRTGHGIGLEVHEPPYLVQGNSFKLNEGMLFTVEPGVYLTGEFGVRIEDEILVTKEGYQNLSADVYPEKELQVI